MTFQFAMKGPVKRRIFPGGLLVTRGFGDFYGKKDFLGGIKGGIVHDHGQVKTVDLRKNKVKYIVLASDGIWDVLQIGQVVDIIEGKQINYQEVDGKSTSSRKALSAIIPESTASPPSSSRYAGSVIT